jgi:hypothetical protein
MQSFAHLGCDTLYHILLSLDAKGILSLLQVERFTSEQNPWKSLLQRQYPAPRILLCTKEPSTSKERFLLYSSSYHISIGDTIVVTNSSRCLDGLIIAHDLLCPGIESHTFTIFHPSRRITDEEIQKRIEAYQEDIPIFDPVWEVRIELNVVISYGYSRSQELPVYNKNFLTGAFYLISYFDLTYSTEIIFTHTALEEEFSYKFNGDLEKGLSGPYFLFGPNRSLGSRKPYLKEAETLLNRVLESYDKEEIAKCAY